MEKDTDLDDGPKLEKVKSGELELGGRIMCNLYNGDRQIIRTVGQSINSQSDIDALFQRGLYKLEGTFVHKRQDSVERSSAGSKFRRGSGGRRLDVAARHQKRQATDVPLEKSKVRVGQIMQLQPRGPDAPQYTVRLIGYLAGKGVIVTPPSMTGEFVMIREWDGFSVKFFSGMSAYTFDASAIKQTLVPYPMLHLTYPRLVRFQQIRQKLRLELELIAVAHDENRKLAASVKIVDLSSGGARLNSKTPLGEVGSGFWLKFQLNVEGIEVLMELKTLVRKAAPANDELGSLTYGVSFHDVPEDMQLALAAFVTNAALEQM
jgi:c-di-GMP-binding flagellar brake protein YcgR